MDASKVAQRVFAWWYQLLKTSGYDSTIGVDPLRIDTKVGLQEENGVVYFKFAPRYYFFGFDFKGGDAIFNTFVPEIDLGLKKDLRGEFCAKLEAGLNNPLKENGNKFEKFFTLPIKVVYEERDFRDETYSGVSIGVETNPMCFSKTKDRMRKDALDIWRKKIFIPVSQFFENNGSYLEKN